MDYTSQVAVAVKRTTRESLRTALSHLNGALDIPSNISHVIIKPSILDTSLPGNSSLEMIRALALTFKNVAPIHIVESDNPRRTTEDAFSKLGISRLEEDGIILDNLTESEMTSIVMAGNKFSKRKMPKLLKEPSFFVNAATLKIDFEKPAVSGGIKNLFGLLPEQNKRVYHECLDDVLLDLLITFKPDLTIVDLENIVVGERFQGDFRSIGGVVVGTDSLAVDAFCTSLFGFEPSRISLLKRANDLGLGEILPERIRVLGTKHQIEVLRNRCNSHIPSHK